MNEFMRKFMYLEDITICILDMGDSIFGAAFLQIKGNVMLYHKSDIGSEIKVVGYDCSLQKCFFVI